MLVHIGQLYDRCFPYESVLVREPEKGGYLIWGSGSRREEESFWLICLFSFHPSTDSGGEETGSSRKWAWISNTTVHVTRFPPLGSAVLGKWCLLPPHFLFLITPGWVLGPCFEHRKHHFFFSNLICQSWEHLAALGLSSCTHKFRTLAGWPIGWFAVALSQCFLYELASRGILWTCV